jgi:hypothetical protein
MKHYNTSFFHIIHTVYINSYAIIGCVYLANYTDNIVICQLNKNKTIKCYCNVSNCDHIQYLLNDDCFNSLSLFNQSVNVIPQDIFKTRIFKSCSICLDDSNKRNMLICPDCSNTFHTKCISKWLDNHITCPNCRSSIWKNYINKK